MMNKELFRRCTAIALAAGLSVSLMACSTGKSSNASAGTQTAEEAAESQDTAETHEDDSQDSSGDSQSGSSDSRAISSDSQVHAEDAEDHYTEITSEFTIESDTESGYTLDGNVYTITKGGTYTLSGLLTEGRIIVDAEGEDVEIILNGVSITSTENSPILIAAAESVDITAASETYNEVIDARTAAVSQTTGSSVTGTDSTAAGTGSSAAGSVSSAADTDDSDDAVDDAEQAAEDIEGNAAIYAKADLDLKGHGYLVIKAAYNNGVQSTKDLEVKNVTIKVTAANNAFKGNDSVSIESGQIILIAEDGDGIKTRDTDISSKGNQRGIVTITGGTFDISAADDGIDAAYDAVIAEEAIINISGESDSAKGIKAENEISISGGLLYISTADDTLHANSGASLESGQAGTGNITISGGSLFLTTQDDAVHADGTLTINDGSITVDTSREGLEGNVIEINGGTIDVYASDDGINAAGSAAVPSITVNGGDITVETGSGDTDTIDSNGNYTQTGGNVLALSGSGSGGMAGTVDASGTVSVTGGTITALGGISGTPSGSSCNTVFVSGQQFTAGTYQITDASGNVIAEFTLDSSFNGGWISSESFAIGETYTITRDGSSFYSWTQNSQSEGSAGAMGGMGGHGGMGGMGDRGNKGGPGGMNGFDGSSGSGGNGSGDSSGFGSNESGDSSGFGSNGSGDSSGSGNMGGQNGMGRPGGRR